MTRFGSEIEPDAPRILIARMSAIGDTILTTPVACALRERFPNAYLGWVVEEKSAHFVKGHPALDEVFVLPRGWFVTPSRIVDLRQQLRPHRFEIAIDCQSITKSALACWLSGAQLRIGCSGKYGCELSPWLNNHLIEPQKPHLTDRSLELLACVPGRSTASDAARWDLPRDLTAEQTVQNWLSQQRLERFVAINPGATWDSKLWSNDRFARVALRLNDVMGIPTVVVWGGAREREWAEEIVAKSRGAARLAPRTSLHELAAMLAQSRLVLSPDTGPMHLAVAVGAPTVGLFGATHPDDCGPYGAPHMAVMKRHHDGGRRERRNANNDAMLEITVDDAYQACLRVLDRTTERFPNAPVSMAS